jgi:hypothetical protein
METIAIVLVGQEGGIFHPIGRTGIPQILIQPRIDFSIILTLLYAKCAPSGVNPWRLCGFSHDRRTFPPQYIPRQLRLIWLFNFARSWIPLKCI